MLAKDTRHDEIHALESELHGIETELEAKKPLHRSLSIAIDALEAEKNEIIYRIYRLRKDQRATQNP